MSNLRKKKYRLYALPMSEANINYCAGERFSRITPDYILVYKRGRAVPTDAVEVTQNETGRLTAADEQWLFDCNVAILGEEVRVKSPEILKNMAEKVDALEKALKEAKESEATKDV